MPTLDDSRRWDQVRDPFCASISQELEREFTWRAEPFVEATYNAIEDRVLVRARVFGGDTVHYSWGHWQLDMESMQHASRQIAHELAGLVRAQPRQGRTWNQSQPLNQYNWQYNWQAQGLSQAQAAQSSQLRTLHDWQAQGLSQAGQLGGQLGAQTLTTFDAMLRERYREGALQDLDITASSALPFLKVEPPKKPAPKPRPAKSRWDRLLADEELV